MASHQEDYLGSLSPMMLLKSQYGEGERPKLSENTWPCSTRKGTEARAYGDSMSDQPLLFAEDLRNEYLFFYF